jgi:hypothetical protein
MHRRLWNFVLAVALAPLCASSQPVVTLGPAGEVSVEASLAPIGDVLERFARVTGAQLSWDGTAPRQLVTLRVQAPSAAAALAAILEGQALNYAVALDATGARVTTLIVGTQATGSHPLAGRSASGSAPTSTAPRGDPRRPPPQQEAEPEPEAESENEAAPEDLTPPEALAPGSRRGERPDREGPGAAPSPESAPTPQPLGPATPQRYPTSPFNPQARPWQPAPPVFPLASPSPTP